MHENKPSGVKHMIAHTYSISKWIYFVIAPPKNSNMLFSSNQKYEKVLYLFGLYILFFIPSDTYLNLKKHFLRLHLWAMPHIKSQVLHCKNVIRFHPSQLLTTQIVSLAFCVQKRQYHSTSMLCQWTTIISINIWHFTWYFWCLNEIDFDCGCDYGINMVAYFNMSMHFSFCFIADKWKQKRRRRRIERNMIITENVCILNNAMATIVNAMNPAHLFKSVKWLQWW